jgi:hypothetical protein
MAPPRIRSLDSADPSVRPLFGHFQAELEAPIDLELIS